MKNSKVGLMLITGSASLATMLVVAGASKAEIITDNGNPRFVEISRESISQPASAITNFPSCHTTSDLPLGWTEDALNNDDKIGDASIARYGCDCTGCRKAIARALNHDSDSFKVKDKKAIERIWCK